MIPFRHLPAYIRAFWKLRGYEPQRATFRGLLGWVRQFPPQYRADLIRLAANLRFVSEQETIKSLVWLNRGVLRALEADDVTIGRVIYMTTDSAGSSSGVMLNLLRDRGNLERRGARFLHSRDANGIRKTTTALGSGAIIYVDDFAGTGKQFTRSREAVADEVVGAFSEFFLLPCICEEASSKIRALGVEPRATIVHKRSERPLLRESGLLSSERLEGLLALSGQHWGPPRKSLGFKGLATNVVLYRNAPNTTPLIFRGHLEQQPLRGIVPRFDDLPVENS